MVVNERDITEIDAPRLDLEEREAIEDGLRSRTLETRLAELEPIRIIAGSPGMMTLLRRSMKVDGVDSTVLIPGKPGAGKGAMANLIHK